MVAGAALQRQDRMDLGRDGFLLAAGRSVVLVLRALGPAPGADADLRSRADVFPGLSCPV